MPDLVLHVSKPERHHSRYAIPDAFAGSLGHYMYDISLSVKARPRKGSRVFLWGTQRSGKHGLFGYGECENPDDTSVAQEKEFDAFMVVRHERVLSEPILPQDLVQRYGGLAHLSKKIEASTLLELFRLIDVESQLLHQALTA